ARRRFPRELFEPFLNRTVDQAGRLVLIEIAAKGGGSRARAEMQNGRAGQAAAGDAGGERGDGEIGRGAAALGNEGADVDFVGQNVADGKSPGNVEAGQKPGRAAGWKRGAGKLARGVDTVEGGVLELQSAALEFPIAGDRGAFPLGGNALNHFAEP